VDAVRTCLEGQLQSCRRRGQRKFALVDRQMKLNSVFPFGMSIRKRDRVCSGSTIDDCENLNHSNSIRFARIFAAVILVFLLHGCERLAGEDAVVKFDETKNTDTQTESKKRTFVHPGIAHTLESIEFTKSKLNRNEEPWTEAWKLLSESRFASLSWRQQPRKHVERGSYNNPNIGASDFISDGTAAYTHAIHWVLSGEVRHARKSAEIIDAWSSKLESVTNHDARLLIGMAGHQYCNAAELLKHTWNGWAIGKQKQFELMLRNVWYPVIKDFYPTANGNWDASMLQTMIAMGVVLEDEAIFDRSVEYFRKGKGNGAIRNYFNESGQCQESGRDQSHTQMGLEFLANTCETAWSQDIDLYGEADNRLLKGFEYTAKYNLGFDVPYRRFKSYEGRYDYKKISKDGRGRLRPMYEKVFNHYHNRKRLHAPFTKLAMEKNRPENSRHVSLPWGTLMFANQPASFKENK